MPIKNYFAREVRTAFPACFAFFSGSDVCRRVPLAMVSLSEFFSSVQVRLVIGLVILSILLVGGIVFLLIYRKRFLIFSKKCDDLGSKLKKTSGELNATRELLTQETTHHREMLNDAGAAIFELSDQGDCVYANAALSTLTGLQEGRLLGDGLIESVHAEDREKVRAIWQGFATREPPFEFSYRIQQKDAGMIHVMERGSLLRNSQQEITGYFAQVMDASAPLIEAQTARRAEQRSGWFIEEITEGFFKLDFDEPVDINGPKNEVADQIYQNAKITAFSGDLAAFCGQPAEKLVGTRFKNLADGCGFFESPADVQRFVDSAFRISSAEGVRNDRRGTPVFLSYQAVGIIENDQLIAIWGTQQDITRQKREMEEARHREELLQRILNCLPGSVSVKDPHCRYLYVNRGFEEQTGMALDDCKGKTIFELLPAASRDINKMSIEAMKTGELCRRVDPRTDEGKTSWMETLETPLVGSDGVVEGVVGISIDVTDQTLREQILQASETQFRGMVEHSPVAVMLSDAGSRALTYANPAFCDLFGYTADEIPRLKVDDLHSPGSRRQVLENWKEHAQQSEHFKNTLPCLRKDRATIFADVGVALGTFDGKEQVVAVYRDAAAQKEIETKLERQRDQQIELLRSASALVVSVDACGVIRSANDAVLELLCLEEADVLGKRYSEAMVCEEDRELVEDAFKDPEPGFQRDCEVRLAAADGQLHTVACRIRTLFDASGKTDGFTVGGMDVTQLRKTEQQLRRECGEMNARLAEYETKLSAESATCREAEAQKAALTEKLKNLEETLTSDEEHFEMIRAKNETRVGELVEAIETLEAAKVGVEEALEGCRTQLEAKEDECRTLEDQLKHKQDEFDAEKERVESAHADRVEALEKTINKFCDREDELETECAKLKSSLSKTTQRYQGLKESVQKERSVREAEEALQSTLLQKLQKNTKEQQHRLRVLNMERGDLKRELAAARKELEVHQSREKQSPAAQRKEKKQLQADKKRIADELEQSEALLNELNQELYEKQQELYKKQQELKQVPESCEEPKDADQSSEQKKPEKKKPKKKKPEDARVEEDPVDSQLATAKTVAPFTL